jgi:hypothetical protein
MGAWVPLAIGLLIAADRFLPIGFPRATCNTLVWYSILISIPGSIIIGYAARFVIGRGRGQLTGRGLATTGIWLSAGTVLLFMLLLAFQWGLTLFYFLLIVGLFVIGMTWRKKQQWFRRITPAVVGILAVYYFAFEYVPRGDVRGDQKTNGIPFRELAGNYYHGDGLGVNCSMTITAEGRFDFLWVGCLGVYGSNKGVVKVSGECIELVPKRKNIQNGFGGTPTVFFPIKWSDRIYLVPKNKIVDFCSCANSGREPRNRPHGRFYLRRTDWEKPATGEPNLPAEFRDYLLKTPVTGTIVALRDTQTGIISLGSKNGLRSGMTLTAQGKPGLVSSTVRIMQTRETNSVVKCEWKDDKLVVGQTVTSKF